MKKKNRAIRVLSLLLILLSLGTVLTVFGVYFYAEFNIDYEFDENLLRGARGENRTKFYYDASYGKGEYVPEELVSLNRPITKSWYAYGEIGDNLKSAFIAVEDRDFFKHHGVNLKRTCFAAFNYLFRIKSKFGASTITQQLIKNISGDSEQTLRRKFSEILRAIHMEGYHSKDEIFEAYLNVIPMGNGIMGVGLASERYFGKTPDDLTAAEVATLVGITNAPARYNPRTNPELCVEKRNKVLNIMLDYGVICEAEYEKAKTEELVIIEAEEEEKDHNSWLIETIYDDMASDLANAKKISKSAARLMLMNGGYSVYTTANPKVQCILESYFENTDNFPQAIAKGLQYSMVIVDSNSGDLLGIVGGVGKKRADLILNYALTPITPGSSLKPLALYAPALEKKYVNWATVFDDVPLEFKKNSDGTYVEYPKNYPQVYDGLITLSDALRLSKNTVAVRLYNLLGKENIFNGLKNNFGFDIVDAKIMSDGRKITDKASSPLALGQLSYGIPLKQLTGAYTVFGRSGEFSEPKSYISVYDSNGKLFMEKKTETKRIFSKETTQIMNQLLMRVTESGTAKQISLGDIVDTAGKTGTSGNDKDRVFVGYTPYFTAGIWCGYIGKEKSIGSQSISHLEIWDNVMKEIHEVILGPEELVESFSCDELVRLPFCKDSGKLFSVNCMHDPRGSRLDYGYFTSDNKPEGICEKHVLCDYDVIGGGVATDACPKQSVVQIALLDISDRSFPKEIFIKDAEYVYRKIEKGTRLGDSYELPYFIFSLKEGEYAGISKGKKQYNASCARHS